MSLTEALAGVRSSECPRCRTNLRAERLHVEEMDRVRARSGKNYRPPFACYCCGLTIRRKIGTVGH